MFLRGLGGAALLVVLLFVAPLFARAPAKQQLPKLELTTLQGRAEQLEQPHGEPTVVYLWTTDCAACRDEFELLASAARSAQYGRFRYLFVNQGNDEAAIQRYLERYSLADVAANVYLDPKNSVYDALGAGSLPASYFFLRSGVLYGAQGLISRPDELEYTLEPLLK